MRYVSLLLILVLSLLPSTAFACDPGDKVVGPNCVHSYELEQSDTSGFLGPVKASMVYRGSGQYKLVVWSGAGTIIRASLKRLTVRIYMVQDTINKEVVDYSRTFDWQRDTREYK